MSVRPAGDDPARLRRRVESVSSGAPLRDAAALHRRSEESDRRPHGRRAVAALLAVTGTGSNLPQLDFTKLALSQPVKGVLRVQMTLASLALACAAGRQDLDGLVDALPGEVRDAERRDRVSDLLRRREVHRREAGPHFSPGAATTRPAAWARRRAARSSSTRLRTSSRAEPSRERRSRSTSRSSAASARAAAPRSTTRRSIRSRRSRTARTQTPTCTPRATRRTRSTTPSGTHRRPRCRSRSRGETSRRNRCRRARTRRACSRGTPATRRTRSSGSRPVAAPSARFRSRSRRRMSRTAVSAAHASERRFGRRMR